MKRANFGASKSQRQRTFSQRWVIFSWMAISSMSTVKRGLTISPFLKSWRVQILMTTFQERHEKGYKSSCCVLLKKNSYATLFLMFHHLLHSITTLKVRFAISTMSLTKETFGPHFGHYCGNSVGWNALQSKLRRILYEYSVCLTCIRSSGVHKSIRDCGFS